MNIIVFSGNFSDKEHKKCTQIHGLEEWSSNSNLQNTFKSHDYDYIFFFWVLVSSIIYIYRIYIYI